MPLPESLLACHRLGMGARPGDCETVTSDPRGWLLAQLTTSTGSPREFRRLPTGAAVSLEMQGTRGKGSTARKSLRQEHRKLYRQEALARTLVGVTTERPLVERLVRFFSDVFTVSITRIQCIGLVGAFEREVIRPRVTGRFADLLIAATQHPAMLVYLDNLRSTGPESLTGSRHERGLNENLAREILELHTLGVGNYTQDDVAALSNILTGWTVGADGDFTFATRRHQPGAQTLLGVRYSADDQKQGEAALTALARHPATARRLSWRMARHFIADDPPEPVVEALTRAYTESDGDLTAVVVALIRCKATWSGELVKLRRPDELVIASLRALRPVPRLTTDQEANLLTALAGLGQSPWSAPSPEGWPDTAADWLGGDAFLNRLQWSWEVSRMAMTDHFEPVARVHDILPHALSRSAIKAIKAAPDRQTAAALLLACPAFQRR
ncbi:MAG: hypothetical protein ACI8RZ_002698 [Myxococcota bacterium]|jgi:uncharacterized protein (DUF1800 family)